MTCLMAHFEHRDRLMSALHDEDLLTALVACHDLSDGGAMNELSDRIRVITTIPTRQIEGFASTSGKWLAA